jgi:hypothetical protein
MSCHLFIQIDPSERVNNLSSRRVLRTLITTWQPDSGNSCNRDGLFCRDWEVAKGTIYGIGQTGFI